MNTIFVLTKISKSNESEKFVLKLSQKLDLKYPNQRVALQNLEKQITAVQNNNLKKMNSNVQECV